jgi:hypothetical protein
MQEQFEKLRNQALETHVFFWGAGESDRYYGSINPAGIIERTVDGKSDNHLILAEHVATIHLGLGFEDLPAGTEAVVLAALDQHFELARLDVSRKTLGGVSASDTPDGTIKDFLKPPKPRRVTWRLLYPDPKTVLREFRALPPEIEALCQIVENGTRHHRDQRLEALNNMQDRLDEMKEFLPELHERLNPLVGQAEDMGIEYFIAATLANLGDFDNNIIREIGFHLALCDQNGGGVWDTSGTKTIKSNALRAIGDWHDPDAVILIGRHMNDDDLEVRKAAIWALGSSGQEDGRKLLEEILSGNNADEIQAAQVALEFFGTATYDQIRARSREAKELPKMPTMLYIHRNGKEFGPYPLNQAKEWLGTGQLVATDLAHYEGADGWVPLSLVPGIS